MKHSTLFIDESGKSSLMEDPSGVFILTGVILDSEEIGTVTGFFNYIKRKLDIDTKLPFHSYHVFENLDTKITGAKARDLTKRLADFLSLIPIEINVLSINKEDFKYALGVKTLEDFKGASKRKEMREYPYRIMSSYLFEWFAKYIKKNSEIGQIIADSRKGGDYQLLKSLSLCKDPNGPMGSDVSKIIKDKCNAICFAEKNFLSGGLEIVDLISYTSFFNARLAMNSMKNIRLDHIWIEIKKQLDNNKIQKITADEIRKFFSVDSNGVHKHLKKGS